MTPTDARRAALAETLRQIDWTHDAGMTACRYPGNNEACDNPQHYYADRAQVARVLAQEEPLIDISDELHRVFTRHGIASYTDHPGLAADVVSWAMQACRQSRSLKVAQEEPPPLPDVLTDDQLLEMWRAVSGPVAQLNGPLIRYAGLVQAAQTQTIVDLTAARDTAILDVHRALESKIGNRCDHHKQRPEELWRYDGEYGACPICWKAAADAADARLRQCAQERDELRDTPAARFVGLLRELQQRFPDSEPYSAKAPEERILKAIDALHAAHDRAIEQIAQLTKELDAARQNR